MDPPLLALPVEILNRIWQACDEFPQVLALASTCKRAHKIWLAHSPSIIWSVGRSQIVSFNDALMAVSVSQHVSLMNKIGSSRAKYKLGTSNGHCS